MVVAYKEFWARWKDFDGRSGLEKFWLVFLINIIITSALMFITTVFSALNSTLGLIAWILYLVYVLVSFIPDLALGVRRLHDSDKTGWMLLIGLVPFVGPLVVLVLMVLSGTVGPNKYGPQPDAKLNATTGGEDASA